MCEPVIPEFEMEMRPRGKLARVAADGHRLARTHAVADTLEQGKNFRIQVAGERVYVPSDVVINIEHERDGANEEIEFQLKWANE